MIKTKKLKLTVITIALACLMLPLSFPISSAQSNKFFFTIHIATTDTRLPICETLKDSLAQIGINLEINVMEWAATDELVKSSKTYAEGGWDMENAGHTEIEVEPDAESEILQSKSATPFGRNYASYANPTVDRLFAEGKIETNLTKRKEIYQQLFKQVYNDQPILCAYQIKAYYVWRTEVQGIENFATWRPTVSDPPWCMQNVSIPGMDTISFGEYFWYPNLLPLYFNYMTGVYSNLVRLNPNFEVVPDLATSWEISTDGLTYTFHLRPGVKFHDGHPLTSSDVKFSFAAKMDPESGSEVYSTLVDNLGTADAIEIPDDLTVIFHIKTLNAGFLYQLTKYLAMEILPEHVLGSIPPKDWKTSDYNTKNAVPGTGMWKFVEITDSYMKLEANPDYYFGAPKMKYCIYRRIPEKATALAALENNEIQMADFFYHMEVDNATIMANPKLKVNYGNRLDIESMVFNTKHPILNNIWVRKAISASFPRENFTQNVFLGTPAWLPLPVGHWAEPKDVQPIYYDINKAKEYMGLAGYNYEWLTTSVENPWTNYVLYIVAGVAIGAIISVGALQLIKRKKH